MELGQISAVYLNDLAQYQRILKQKNNCLKATAIGPEARHYNVRSLKPTICTALNVTLRREHFIKELESLAKPIHAGITNEREKRCH